MKRCYFFFLTVLLMVVSINGQNNQELFLQANLAYELDNYVKSLELYEKISHKSSAVLYNMGNCYYKKGNIVEALVYWKRAQKQANRMQYATIEHNIQKLIQKYGVEYETEGLLIYFFKTISRYFSLFIWQLLFFLFWLFLWMGLPFIKRKRKLIFSGNLIGLLFAGTMIYFKTVSKHVAIAKEDTPIYIGPSEHFAQQTLLKKAQEVSIKEKNNNWYKVATTKKVGWISGERLIEV